MCIFDDDGDDDDDFPEILVADPWAHGPGPMGPGPKGQSAQRAHRPKGPIGPWPRAHRPMAQGQSAQRAPWIPRDPLKSLFFENRFFKKISVNSCHFQIFSEIFKHFWKKIENFRKHIEN